MNRLFVYGSLLPGQPNWPVLAPWVIDDGLPASVPGELFDTGEGWPAAVFAPVDTRVVGRIYTLRDDMAVEAWSLLDEFEDVPTGQYTRVEVVSDDGLSAWAYNASESPLVGRVDSGDWVTHRAEAGPA